MKIRPENILTDSIDKIEDAREELRRGRYISAYEHLAGAKLMLQHLDQLVSIRTVPSTGQTSDSVLAADPERKHDATAETKQYCKEGR